MSPETLSQLDGDRLLTISNDDGSHYAAKTIQAAQEELRRRRATSRKGKQMPASVDRPRPEDRKHQDSPSLTIPEVPNGARLVPMARMVAINCYTGLLEQFPQIGWVADEGLLDDWDTLMTIAGVGAALRLAEGHLSSNERHAISGRLTADLRSVHPQGADLLSDLTAFVQRSDRGGAALADAIGMWVIWNLRQRKPAYEEAAPARPIGALLLKAFDERWAQRSSATGQVTSSPTADPLASFQPELVIVTASRKDVEQINVKPVLAVLSSFLAGKDRVVALQQRVGFFIEGYDADHRELAEIPEVRRFLAELDRAFSYWFYFISPVADTLKLLLFCLCRVKKVKGRLSLDDPTEFGVFLSSHYVAMNDLFNRFGLAMDLNKKISDDVMRFFVSQPSGS